MCKKTSKISIKIQSAFSPFVGLAISRYGYLFPDHEITADEQNVCISGYKCFSTEEAKENFLHLLYKEKIYADTLDIRKSIFKAIVHE